MRAGGFGAMPTALRGQATPITRIQPQEGEASFEVVMHHGEFTTLDWILLALVPPMLGSGIGLLLGMARGRPGRATVAGLVGGAAGAWAGVIAYCLAILPRLDDSVIFTGCILTGFFLGAVPLGFFLAGPPDPTRAPSFEPASRPVGGMLGGFLGLLVGFAVAYLSVEPGSASGLEFIGYFLWPMIGMTIGVVAGLLTLQLPGKRPHV
jgi:hypothetical protein